MTTTTTLIRSSCNNSSTNKTNKKVTTSTTTTIRRSIKTKKKTKAKLKQIEYVLEQYYKSISCYGSTCDTDTDDKKNSNNNNNNNQDSSTPQLQLIPESSSTSYFTSSSQLQSVSTLSSQISIRLSTLSTTRTINNTSISKTSLLSLSSTTTLNPMQEDEPNKQPLVWWWKLRELGLSDCGYCTDSIRQRIWPILIGGGIQKQKEQKQKQQQQEQQQQVSSPSIKSISSFSSQNNKAEIDESNTNHHDNNYHRCHTDYNQIQLDVARNSWDHLSSCGGSSSSSSNSSSTTTRTRKRTSRMMKANANTSTSSKTTNLIEEVIQLDVDNKNIHSIITNDNKIVDNYTAPSDDGDHDYDQEDDNDDDEKVIQERKRTLSSFIHKTLQRSFILYNNKNNNNDNNIDTNNQVMKYVQHPASVSTSELQTPSSLSQDDCDEKYIARKETTGITTTINNNNSSRGENRCYGSIIVNEDHIDTKSDNNNNNNSASIARQQKKEEFFLRYYQGYHDYASIIVSVLMNHRQEVPSSRHPNQHINNNADDEARTESSNDIFSISHEEQKEKLIILLLYNLSCTHMIDYMDIDFIKVRLVLQYTIFPMLSIVDDQVHTFLAKECNMTEPMFAISWILTWFSHDLLKQETSTSSRSTNSQREKQKQRHQLDLVKRIYDFFLVSHPLMPFYTTVALMTHPVSKNMILYDTIPADFAEAHGTLARLPYNLVLSSLDIEDSDDLDSYNDDDDDDDDDYIVNDTANDIGDEEINADEMQSRGTLEHCSKNQVEPNRSVPIEEVIAIAISIMDQIPPHMILDIEESYSRSRLDDEDDIDVHDINDCGEVIPLLRDEQDRTKNHLILSQMNLFQPLHLQLPWNDDDDDDDDVSASNNIPLVVVQKGTHTTLRKENTDWATYLTFHDKCKSNSRWKNWFRKNQLDKDHDCRFQSEKSKLVHSESTITTACTSNISLPTEENRTIALVKFVNEFRKSIAVVAAGYGDGNGTLTKRNNTSCTSIRKKRGLKIKFSKRKKIVLFLVVTFIFVYLSVKNGWWNVLLSMVHNPQQHSISLLVDDQASTSDGIETTHVLPYDYGRRVQGQSNDVVDVTTTTTVNDDINKDFDIGHVDESSNTFLLPFQQIRLQTQTSSQSQLQSQFEQTCYHEIEIEDDSLPLFQTAFELPIEIESIQIITDTPSSSDTTCSEPELLVCKTSKASDVNFQKWSTSVDSLPNNQGGILFVQEFAEASLEFSSDSDITSVSSSLDDSIAMFSKKQSYSANAAIQSRPAGSTTGGSRFHESLLATRVPKHMNIPQSIDIDRTTSKIVNVNSTENIQRAWNESLSTFSLLNNNTNVEEIISHFIGISSSYSVVSDHAMDNNIINMNADKDYTRNKWDGKLSSNSNVCMIAGKVAQLLCLVDGSQLCRPFREEGIVDLIDLSNHDIASFGPCRNHYSKRKSMYDVKKSTHPFHDDNNQWVDRTSIVSIRCPLEYGSCGEVHRSMMICNRTSAMSISSFSSYTEDYVSEIDDNVDGNISTVVNNTTMSKIMYSKQHQTPVKNGHEVCVQASIGENPIIMEVNEEFYGSEILREVDHHLHICGCCDGFDPDIRSAGSCNTTVLIQANTLNDINSNCTVSEKLPVVPQSYNPCCHPCRSQVPILYRPCWC